MFGIHRFWLTSNLLSTVFGIQYLEVFVDVAEKEHACCCKRGSENRFEKRCGLRNSKNDTSLRFTYHHLSPPPTLNRSESPRDELYKISNCLRGNSVGGRLGVVWRLSAFAHCLPPLHSS